MTFYQGPEERDVNPYVREPTRQRDKKTFEDESLTVSGHEDPSIHYIGESLQPPSRNDIASSGFGYTEGASPLVARADHAHDTTTVFMTGGQFATQTIPPGQTFLNGFNHTGGRNLFAPASTQVVIPNLPGYWEFDLSVEIQRPGGGVFTGELNVVFFYLNGTVAKIIWRDTMAAIPGSRVIHAVDSVFAVGAPGPTVNWQAAIQHNDAINLACFIQHLKVTRLHDLNSA